MRKKTLILLEAQLTLIERLGRDYILRNAGLESF